MSEPLRRRMRPGYADTMDADDGPDHPRLTDVARARLPYAIGLLGLIAWFTLLYCMLRDAL